MLLDGWDGPYTCLTCWVEKVIGEGDKTSSRTVVGGWLADKLATDLASHIWKK